MIVRRRVLATCPGLLALTLAGVLCPPPRVAAQETAPAAAVGISVGPLLTLGSAGEDRFRIEQLLGLASTEGFLLRAPSSLTAPPPVGPGGFGVRLLLPELRAVSNSAIPYSLNDGGVWAGRGTSLLLLTGLQARLGPVVLTLAPELVHTGNRDFEIVPPEFYRSRPGRNPFGSLWYTEGGDIDLPHRFGDERLTGLHAGQSSLVATAGPVAAGVATENQWWGPGIRNAILMSNNAPGFPHAFLRTAAPLRTLVGGFEGKWLLGRLRESAFYDSIPDNDLRSLSGLVLTYSPALDPRLTLGIARTVVSPASGNGQVASHALRVLGSWERRDSVTQVEWEPGTDQILALFGRWVLPADGAEVYFEWARHELPVSFRDFLLAPHHTQGYTIGGQWARPTAPGVVRVQAEVTQLEQSTTFKQRPLDPLYTGRAAPQGYTHLGQVIGAAIGPGSSGQWLAVDLLRDRARLGLFAGRIRWENDTFYDTPPHNPNRGHRTPHAHDVSVLGGLRGGYTVAGMELGAELTLAYRYNFLFQNPDREGTWDRSGAVDVRNHTLRFHIGPAQRSALVRNAKTQ